MYNNLAQTNANLIGNYAGDLLASSQADVASVLGNLMLLYLNGYNVLSDTQKQSLTTSKGNATTTQTSSSPMYDSAQAMQMALQMAMMAATLGA